MSDLLRLSIYNIQFRIYIILFRFVSNNFVTNLSQNLTVNLAFGSDMGVPISSKDTAKTAVVSTTEPLKSWFSAVIYYRWQATSPHSIPRSQCTTAAPPSINMFAPNLLRVGSDHLHPPPQTTPLRARVEGVSVTIRYCLAIPAVERLTKRSETLTQSDFAHQLSSDCSRALAPNFAPITVEGGSEKLCGSEIGLQL